MQLILSKFDEMYKKDQEEKSTPPSSPRPPSSIASTLHTPPPSLVHPSPPSPADEPPAKKQRVESLVDYGSSDEEQELVLTLEEMKEVVEQQKMLEPHDPKIRILGEIVDEIQDDERIITSMRFMDDDDFIHKREFKYFWIKIQMKRFNDRLKINLIGIDDSKYAKVQAQTMAELDIDSINITPKEARELVLSSKMLIIPRMEISKVFLLNQIRAQDDPNLVAEFDLEGVSGTGYNPIAQTFALWKKQKNTRKPRLLDVVQEMQGFAMVKKMKDTTPIEEATITMHYTMFKRDVVKKMEKKITEYEKRLKLSNDEINKLFIEGFKLKQQSQQATDVKGDEIVVYHPPALVEDPKIPQLKKEIEILKKHNMDDVRQHMLSTLKEILKHRVGVFKEKISGVHEGFNHLVKALEQINNNSSILEELHKRWQPTYHILTTLCKATQRDPNAPPRLKPTQEMVKAVIDEHKYLIDIKKKINNRRNSFDSIKHSFIPLVIRDDGKFKDMDEWKNEFGQMVPQCLTCIQGDGDINLEKFHTLLDGIMTLDNGYTKFVVDAKNFLDCKWKGHLVTFTAAQELKWLNDLTIRQWQEKYLGSDED